MTASFSQDFGQFLWSKLGQQSFGSLSKRELEILILQAASHAELICENNPVQTAALLQLSLSRTHSYLSELSLRRSMLSDGDALLLLVDVLKRLEILQDDKYISIHILRADLRLWIERKLANEGMHPGESIRRDIVKLTPRGLLRLLDNSVAVIRPSEALEILKMSLPNSPLLASLEVHSLPHMKWQDVLSSLGSVASVTSAVISLVPLILK